MRRLTLLAATLTLLLTAGASQAGWSFGFHFGAPVRPYYGYGYGPYCYRPRVVVAPVYVAPPVYVRPAVVAVPAYEAGYEAPAVPAVPAVPDASPVARPQPRRQAVPVAANANLTGLNDPSAKVRAEAAIRLGRQKDTRAVQPLIKALQEDKSAEVRESAARALGLIGSSSSLSALQDAAQGDDDRDVRKSASFAAEVIRANLRR